MDLDKFKGLRVRKERVRYCIATVGTEVSGSDVKGMDGFTQIRQEMWVFGYSVSSRAVNGCHDLTPRLAVPE